MPYANGLVLSILIYRSNYYTASLSYYYRIGVVENNDTICKELRKLGFRAVQIAFKLNWISAFNRDDLVSLDHH